MSWKEVKIGDVVELQQGLCINKKSKHLVVSDGIPLLRITDLINNTQEVF
jgi:type I restriction enzyme S subunit